MSTNADSVSVRSRSNRDKGEPVTAALPFSQLGGASDPWIHQQADPAPDARRQCEEAYADELTRRRRLRFTPRVEEQFQIDTRAEHWKRVIVCTLIGHVSIWLNAVIEQHTLAEIGPRLLWMWALVSLTAFVVLGGCVWLVPRRAARAWHIDLAAVTPTLMTSCMLLWPSTVSDSYNATMHAADTMLVVLWACVLARQRFWFAAVPSLLTFAAAALLTDGPTLEQQQIAVSNLKSLGITVLFALVANYALEYHQRRTYLLHKLDEARRSQLLHTAHRLSELSLRDPLTGIHNRRHFDQQLQEAWVQMAVARLPLALVVVDVDFFKRFNDAYGHPMGDACLKQVARVLQQMAADAGGCAARLGGEEFGLLLPYRDVGNALHVARRLCVRVAELAVSHHTSGAAPYVTISAGVAALTPPASSPDSAGAVACLQKAADAALYEAKQAGRNRACARAVLLDESMPQVPGAASATGPSDAAATPVDAEAGADLLGVLQGGFRWLRFPADVESHYQELRTESRRRRLIAATISGAVIYNAYLWSGRDLIPEIISRLTLAHALVTGLHVLVVVLLCWPALKRDARETLYTAKVASSVAITLWALVPAQSLAVYAAYVGLLLIPMSGAVAGRMPFRHGCWAGVVTLVGFALSASFSAPFHLGLLLEVIVMMTIGITFVVLVSYAVEHGDRTDYLLGRLEQEQRHALAQAHAELQRLTMQDPLTGLPNRRRFESDFSRVWAEAHGDTVSMLIADVDFFKPYNDNYGHPAGDACLKRLAVALNELAEREGVLAARLGGEEFGVLLPRTDKHEAQRLAQKLCDAVRALCIEHMHSQVAGYVTISVGVATLRADGAHSERELFSHADAALYSAKAAGRDRVSDRGGGLDNDQAPPSPDPAPRLQAA